MIEGIGRHFSRLHQHHILQTVVDEFRNTHREAVVFERLLVQQEITVLDHIHNHGLHRTTHHLDAQCVARFLTQQSASLDNGHTVARRPTVIRCLVKILHTLSHIDVVLALHRRLTVETLQQFGHHAVVLWNLPDGSLYQFPGILVHHDNLSQHNTRRFKTDLQTFCNPRLQFHLTGLVAQMGYRDTTRQFRQFQREHTIFVGHHRHSAGRDAHLPQFFAGLVVYHIATDHHLLCEHCQRGEQQDYQP